MATGLYQPLVVVCRDPRGFTVSEYLPVRKDVMVLCLMTSE